MSIKYYAVFVLNKGYERIDLSLPHDAGSAKKFVKLIGHTRHTYAREVLYEKGVEDTDLIVFSNCSGTIAFHIDLALDFALDGKKAGNAARYFNKVVGVAFNDQCLTDAFSYYENGKLLRRVNESDGDERNQVTFEGEMLLEEIESIKNAKPDLDCDPEELSQFTIDGITYTVEGYVPLYGAGLEVAKRLIDADPLDILLPQSSVFYAKPWWHRW